MCPVQTVTHVSGRSFGPARRQENGPAPRAVRAWLDHRFDVERIYAIVFSLHHDFAGHFWVNGTEVGKTSRLRKCVGKLLVRI